MEIGGSGGVEDLVWKCGRDDQAFALLPPTRRDSRLNANETRRPKVNIKTPLSVCYLPGP